MIVNPISFGSGGGLSPQIIVHAPTGSTVQLDGVTGTEVSGVWTFDTTIGTHTVSVTYNGATQTQSVSVTEVAQYAVEIMPSVIVTAPTGSTVTLDGVAGTEVSGTWTFTGVSIGTHTVVGTKDSSSKTVSVSVTALQAYSVTISYSFTLTISSKGSKSTSASVVGSYLTIDGGSAIYSIGSRTVYPGATLAFYGKTGVSGSQVRVQCQLNRTSVGDFSTSYASYNLLYTLSVSSNLTVGLVNQGVGSMAFITITTS